MGKAPSKGTSSLFDDDEDEDDDLFAKPNKKQGPKSHHDHHGHGHHDHRAGAHDHSAHRVAEHSGHSKTKPAKIDDDDESDELPPKPVIEDATQVEQDVDEESDDRVVIISYSTLKKFLVKQGVLDDTFNGTEQELVDAVIQNV